MDQGKVGSFLKELRKEKNLTQEQLAEQFLVTRRTVSRWETGSNLPDLDILIEMADFYDVDLREILDGERKSENMNSEVKETLLKAAEYSNEEKKRLARGTLNAFIAGLAAILLNILMECLNLPEEPWVDFLRGVTTGMPFAAMIIGILYITGALNKVKDFKLRMIGRNHNE